MQGSERVFEELIEDIDEGKAAGEDSRRLPQAMFIHGLLAGKHADPDKLLSKIRPDRRLGPLRVLALAASLILGAVLLWLAYCKMPERPTAVATAAELTAGRLKDTPADSKLIALAKIVSTEDETASILCRDGSSLELEAGSIMRILGPVHSDRWRVELLAGAIKCTVPQGHRPFRLVARAADVITESTQFSVRTGAIRTGASGIVVRVTEGTVRVESRGRPIVKVSADEIRIVPEPGGSNEHALLALLLLFPEELVKDVKTEWKGDLLEIEGKVVDGEVEAIIAPGGIVESYALEVSGGRLDAEVPNLIRQAIKMEFGAGVTLLEVGTKFEKGLKTYEVEIRSKGRDIEVELDPFGNIIGREEG